MEPIDAALARTLAADGTWQVGPARLDDLGRLVGLGELAVELVVPLEEVLAGSDIVTVHLPKTPETLGLIGKEELALARDVQREVIRRFIEHVDLLVVRRGDHHGVGHPPQREEVIPVPELGLGGKTVP